MQGLRYILRMVIVKRGNLVGIRIAGWWLFAGVSQFTPGVR